VKTITVREIRQRWPEAESLLQREEELMITRDGRPVARLLPVAESKVKRKRFDPAAHTAWQERVHGGKTTGWVEKHLVAERSQG
jgi:antitoxin (DNA-binding transcriptional repressor) of toxin-antitoxin stability system